ncbi:uncharacterized protein METZ01_LOCUS223513, partial [marine metagenome]
QGNTVIVIEHNLDIIKTADHVIDLGPEGGLKGGYIVAVGTPEEIAKIPESFTGQYLDRCFKKKIKRGKKNSLVVELSETMKPIGHI